MESKGTQKDDTDMNASGNSPLMMGYEVSFISLDLNLILYYIQTLL